MILSGMTRISLFKHVLPQQRRRALTERSDPGFPPSTPPEWRSLTKPQLGGGCFKHFFSRFLPPLFNWER